MNSGGFISSDYADNIRAEVDRTDYYPTSFVPPVITGEAAKMIIVDLQRPATELEIAVLRRALKNRIKRKERNKECQKKNES